MCTFLSHSVRVTAQCKMQRQTTCSQSKIEITILADIKESVSLHCLLSLSYRENIFKMTVRFDLFTEKIQNLHRYNENDVCISFGYTIVEGQTIMYLHY